MRVLAGMVRVQTLHETVGIVTWISYDPRECREARDGWLYLSVACRGDKLVCNQGLCNACRAT
eukprot:4019355-Pyramimonas_sp.AAC.1